MRGGDRHAGARAAAAGRQPAAGWVGRGGAVALGPGPGPDGRPHPGLGRGLSLHGRPIRLGAHPEGTRPRPQGAPQGPPAEAASSGRLPLGAGSASPARPAPEPAPEEAAPAPWRRRGWRCQGAGGPEAAQEEAEAEGAAQEAAEAHGGDRKAQWRPSLGPQAEGPPRHPADPVASLRPVNVHGSLAIVCQLAALGKVPQTLRIASATQRIICQTTKRLMSSVMCLTSVQLKKTA